MRRMVLHAEQTTKACESTADDPPAEPSELQPKIQGATRKYSAGARESRRNRATVLFFRED